MKRHAILLILVMLTAVTFCACSGAGEVSADTTESLYTIPQITNVDEATAKQLLLNNELIPAVIYENSEDVAQGAVIKTDPVIGTTVAKDAIVTLYVSKGPELRIPDVEGLDLETAKQVLVNCGLIPKVEYCYTDNWDVDTGCALHTEPWAGELAEPNQQVTLWINKGPMYVYSTDSRIRWRNVSDADDHWEFYSPYIEENVLYIECFNVTLGAKVKWRDTYNEGRIIGEASVNDTYDKKVTVSAAYEKQEWDANEQQSFILQIPLNDLDVDKPTSLYISLYADVWGEYNPVEISFVISW